MKLSQSLWGRLVCFVLHFPRYTFVRVDRLAHPDYCTAVYTCPKCSCERALGTSVYHHEW